VLYGVGVYDSAAIASAIVALTSVALVAASIPALRIARIDPAYTLREE
jgi:ABC-type lipoprotein release transport system permease subunit